MAMARCLLLVGPALFPAVQGNVVEFAGDHSVSMLTDNTGIPAETKMTGCEAATPRNRVTDGSYLVKDTPAATRSLTAGAECKRAGTKGVDTPQDCEFCRLTNKDSTTCAAWQNPEGIESLQGQELPRILSYIIGIAMAYAIGGNDSANSLATSVGSKALTLTQAVWMGAVGEFLGATLLGAGVSSTIQRGVADLNDAQCWGCGFCTSEMDKYQGGMLAALFGAAFFLLLVTFWSLPVSTTHAVVGGVVGMTWAAIGFGCLNFSFADGLGRIAAGWVVSPLVAGVIGSAVYAVTYKLIMKANNPKQASLLGVPVLYGLTFVMMTFLILVKAPLFKNLWIRLGWEDLELFGISVLVGLVVAVVAQIVVVPMMRAEVEEAEAELNNTETGAASFASARQAQAQAMKRFSRNSSRGLMAIEGKEGDDDTELKGLGGTDLADASDDGPGLVIFTQSPPTKTQLLAKRVFKNLLVMTAFVKCIGHGANDTANATGIVGAVQFVYEDGIHACQSRTTETYIMAIAGFFVGVGVITMGYRVIKAVGEDLADMDFHVGFCVEFSSACAVVIATIMGLPVSTTHCQIGAIVFVAATAYGRDSVAWGMFGKIAVTWVATLPAAGGVAYILTALRYGFS